MCSIPTVCQVVSELWAELSWKSGPSCLLCAYQVLVVIWAQMFGPSGLMWVKLSGLSSWKSGPSCPVGPDVSEVWTEQSHVGQVIWTVQLLISELSGTRC